MYLVFLVMKSCISNMKFEFCSNRSLGIHTGVRLELNVLCRDRATPRGELECSVLSRVNTLKHLETTWQYYVNVGSNNDTNKK